MKVVVADKISERGLELLRECRWQVVQPEADSLAQEVLDADALIVRSATRVTPSLLEAAARLRVIGRAGVGVDNVDLEAATRRGILVMNTPGGNSVSVAEHTFALMLAMVRQVPQLDSAVHGGRWEKSSALGTELRGKTLGIVGLGRVGTEVARRARSFEMQVLAHDPYVSAPAAREMEVELVSLPELFARCHFISLHAALNPATHNLINAAAIAQMRPGTRLVNCARGELVDEAALAAALRSGHIAAAGLDTFAQEPPLHSPLLALPNVIATPHIAGSTAEAQEEVGTLIAQQVRDYLLQGVLRNAANLPAVSPEQYARLQPYLRLGEQLGAFVMQGAAPLTGPGVLRIRYAGVAAEIGTALIRNAVLAGSLNCVLDEKVNLVNASAVAAARGFSVEETSRRRERGFPDSLEVGIVSEQIDAGEFSVEATILHEAPRVLRVDGIDLEAPLEGHLLLIRSRDVPGVIGQIGTVLGSHGVNIATFALGRRSPAGGAEAISIVRLDGNVTTAILQPLCDISAVREARLIKLAAASAA